jgi:nucleotide-binding universal stress UspA family protein
VELIEGHAAEELCSWAQHHDTDLTVLSSHGARGRTEWGLASTAMKLVERAPGSVLVVPSESVAPSGGVARYRRLLVPLDGSLRAESVLPLAVRIAAHQGAELLLAHIVPQPEITQIGPLSAEDLELRERLQRRNERVAGEYLDRLRSRLAESAVSLRVLVLRGGDVRGRLAHLVGDEAADLVVLSSRGQGGRGDVPCGSVTTYLMTHVTAPLLIVRQRNRRPLRRAAATAHATARLPSQALP